MTSFLTSIHLLNLKQSHPVHSDDIDCLNHYEKNANAVKEKYSEAKHEYLKSRYAKSKQSWRFKKNVRSLEKLFRTYKCLYISWQSNQSLLLFFSNGSMVTIHLNFDNTSFEKIYIDNNLCGKFISSRIVDIIFEAQCVFVTYSEPKLTYINFSHQSFSLSAKIFGRKKGKVVALEPKIFTVDLIGPCSRNLERKVSLNSHKELLLVWWHLTGDDVLPWTPVEYSADRVNMIIYTITECSLEILCSVKLNGRLIHAHFSKCHSNRIFTVEEMKTDQELSVNVCIYELVRDECQILFISKLPLQGNLVAFDWNNTEDKLLVSDSDKLLLVYDLAKRMSIVRNLLFVPSHVLWHHDNCIAIVIGIDNQIQCFDSALTCIQLQLFHKSFIKQDFLHLNQHFKQHFAIHKVLWNNSKISHSCLIVFEAELSFMLLNLAIGSIMQNLTPLEVIGQYLKSNSIDESILLLQSLNWCYESQLSFQCLSKIFNCLIRQPLNHETKAGLELALGTFYNCMDDLPKKIIKLYQHKIRHLARRFFHHLVRYYQLRKAFLLSVDLESQDLFLDLSHIANLKGENLLALAVLHKAEELDYSQDNNYDSSFTSDSTTGSSISSVKEDLLDTVVNHSSDFFEQSIKDSSKCDFKYVAQNDELSPNLFPFRGTNPSSTSEFTNSNARSCYSKQSTSSTYLNSHVANRISDLSSTSKYLKPFLSSYNSSVEHESLNFTKSNAELNGYPYSISNSANRVPSCKESEQELIYKPQFASSFSQNNSETYLFNKKSSLNLRQNSTSKSFNGNYGSETNNIIEDKCALEESENIEDTRIKLVHFGVI